MSEKRQYVLNLKTGIPFFAQSITDRTEYAEVSKGFYRRFKKGEFALKQIADIHARGGDAEAVLTAQADKPKEEARPAPKAWAVRKPPVAKEE